MLHMEASCNSSPAKRELGSVNQKETWKTPWTGNAGDVVSKGQKPSPLGRHKSRRFSFPIYCAAFHIKLFMTPKNPPPLGRERF